MRNDETQSCQLCGRGPARRLVIRRHVGMVVLQRFIRIQPTLCRACGTRTVLQYTGRTLVQGWWGPFSLFIANPFTIVMNLFALARARQLEPPQRSSATVAPGGLQLSPALAGAPHPGLPHLRRYEYVPIRASGGQGTGPLLVSAPVPASAAHDRYGSLTLALLAGAIAALAGGLVWAVVVISTGFDVGFLAWGIGAATGLTAARVLGRPLKAAPQLAAGLLAVGGLLVGKYVIFIHAVKAQIAVDYLNRHEMGIFIHHLGSIVRPIYALWAIVAFIGAVVIAGRAQPKH